MRRMIPMLPKLNTLLTAVLLCVSILSCRTAKPVKTSHRSTTNTADVKVYLSQYRGKADRRAASIIENAESFLGTPYKFGGTAPGGFDCSGLVCTAFKEEGVLLPRRSADQGKEGKPVDVRDIRPGDLLFFSTGKIAGVVTHVGLVSEIGADGDIIFIHSSTSKGVIKSSLNEKYWVNAFLFARRI